jgi:hypothetical protein
MSGGGSSAPTQQNVTTTNIPEYARPYVERTLGQAAALTDINQNPYQPYQGQRIANFSPLQGQAFTSIGDMQVAPQLGQATGYANQATQGGMATATPALGYGASGAGYGGVGAGYGAAATGIGGMYANMATSPGAVSAYMSPYMQNVVDLQKQEANRAYDITGSQVMGKGAAAGAFGGTRDALMRAENERNRNTALAGIQAQGSQSAYDKAIQSMQYGTGIGLQGLQTGIQGAQTGIQGAGMGLQGVQGAQNAYNLGLQGANTLTNIGNAQFAQQMSIADAQMRAGAAQQAQAQRGLDIPYQEYQEQLNYPYKQLAFQSDMFRGLPLSQAATTVYQNTGAMMPQILGAGIAAYGASAGRGAKEGGMVKGYAAGGGVQVDPRALSSVSPASLPSKLSRLSDDQLMAYARTVKDPAAREEVQAEMTRRAEVRQSQQATQAQEAQAQEAQGGIGQQPMMAAGGGIVALNGRSGSTADDPDARPLDVLYPRGAPYTRQATTTAQARDRAERERDAELPPVGQTSLAAAPTSLPMGSVNAATIPTAPSGIMTARPPSEAPERYTAEQNARLAREEQQLAQAQAADSQVQPVSGVEANIAMNEAFDALDMQDADNQVQPRYAGITAAPAATGTPTAATSGIPAAAPAGTTTATGTPTAAAPSSGGITTVSGAPAGGAPAGGGVGTVGIPVGVPGDPMSFATYRANVQDLAKLDPEEKAVLANMEARTLKRLSRAETQEKGVMNEAFIAAGLAMMGGLNLADGVRRAAESGGKQYFASKAEARKAIDKAEDAQDAFDQYRVALKQGNKKLANEMYGTFYKSYTDYVGKIQAAGISAGASLENAKATREATAEFRRSEAIRHDLDRDAMNQRHADTIAQRKSEEASRAQISGDTRVTNQVNYLDQRLRDILVSRSNTEEQVFKRYKGRFDQMDMATASGKITEQQRRAKQALVDEFQAEVLAKTSPFTQQYNEILNKQGELLGVAAPTSGSGFRVVGVR